MERIKVSYFGEDGIIYYREIQRNSVKCPFCKTPMIPQYLHSIGGYNSTPLSVFCQCTNPLCLKPFISEFVYEGGRFMFSRTMLNSSLEQKMFSNIISEVSSSFCEIYNQAYAAQQMNLMQICGVGYRKALEFLIKDYILSFIEEDKKEGIKQKNLAKCIKDNIESSNIKAVAERAVWLGNDETHYVRKWEDKDINDLIGIIDLTIRWIESEIETH